PFTATQGGTLQPVLRWNGVLQKGLYLGVAYYDDGTSRIGQSLVELTKTVDTSATSVSGTVGGTVAPTLALTLGHAPAFGTFVPGLGTTYAAGTTVTVTSTAGDATLSLSDPDRARPGRLVNGAYALDRPLQANARTGGFGT